MSVATGPARRVGTHSPRGFRRTRRVVGAARRVACQPVKTVVTVTFHRYMQDSRGNRLEHRVVRKFKDSDREERRLYMCASPEIARQVTWILEQARLAPRELELRGDDKQNYTHRIELFGPLTTRADTGLALLEEVVTLANKPALDIALALDFYKAPDPDVDPMNWPNTECGQLVYRGKYCDDDSALAPLAEKLAEAVLRHPLLAGADYIVSVPGHTTTKVSFGVRLARKVAEMLGIPFLETSCSLAERPEAKERSETTAELAKVMGLPSDVDGKVVLIVDDVYRSGGSMCAVAAVARQRGARAVAGIAGARTMRS